MPQYEALVKLLGTGVPEGCKHCKTTVCEIAAGPDSAVGSRRITVRACEHDCNICVFTCVVHVLFVLS